MKLPLLKLTLTLCAFSSLSCLAALAQEPAQAEKQESLAVDRYLSILENNPQRGTAFDQVFDYHLQGGTLERFVVFLTGRIKKNENDGTAWMIIGLIESQRRNDSVASEAFAKAEQLRPNDPVAPYYRGQLLFRSGNHKQAVEALEVAVDRKPNRTLLVEIVEQLGRCHERLGQNELADKTWKRLEEQFPYDLRILERIASVQNQEGMFKGALKRYEQLGQLSTDAYQRSQYRIEAAQLRIKLGNTEQGLTELGAILRELNPESWLFKDCQSKLEDNFLKVKDLASLIQFYEMQVAANPNDLESIARLSKHLFSAAKIQDAIDWSTKAVSLAPSRADLRLALIAQLVNGRQWSQADENYRGLSALDPNNIDVAKAWGLFTLNDPSRETDETKQAASRIWHDLLVHRPNDARAHLQVAELLVSSQQVDQAQKLFEKAAELQPDDRQYLEYLGDFYFSQNRREKAFEIWESTTAGTLKSAESLLQLAEIYNRVRLRDLAADRAQEACRLAPKNALYRLRTAEFQKLSNRIDLALENLDSADSLADDDAQHERILNERMELLENSRRLKGAAESLSLELNSKPNSDLSRWQLLVRYLVRMRRWNEADVAVTRALMLDANNVTSLKSAAEITEALGDSRRTISALQKLCDLDRRKRTEYFERIATQQMQLGEKSASIETAQQLIDANPSRIEGYQFFADLCFRSMKFEVGIDALRKALRIDPKSSAIIDSLGNAFSRNGKHKEAIELYKQGFYRAESSEERLELISKLIVHHTSQGSTNALVDMLERDRKQADLRHDLTICLAQVYVSTSDFEKAKTILNELLTTHPRDRMALERLASVCVSTKDLEGAIGYQRQLVAIEPNAEHEAHLSTLLRQHGKREEAEAITLRILRNEPDLVVLIRTLDELLGRGESELVRQTVEPLVKKEPANWLLLYRLGLAYVDLGRLLEAKDAWETVFGLEVSPSATSYQNQLPPNREKAKPEPIAKTLETMCLPIISKFANGDFKFGTSQIWLPQTFGEAQMASLAWLVYCKEMGVASQVIDEFEKDAALDALPTASLLNILALARYQQDSEKSIRAMEVLAAQGHDEILPYFLQAVKARNISLQLQGARNKLQLTESQIVTLLKAFDFVQDPIKSSWVSNNSSNMPPISPAKLITTRFNLSAGYQVSPERFVQTVVGELEYADKKSVAEEFLGKLCDSASSAYQLEMLCEYLLEAKRLDQIEPPLLRWIDVSRSSFDTKSNSATRLQSPAADPVGFVRRYVNTFSNSVPRDRASKLVNAILDLENSRLLAMLFEPIELTQFIWSIGSADQRQSRQPQTETNSVWPSNFVRPLVQTLIQDLLANHSPDECMSLLESRIKDARENVNQFEELRLALMRKADSLPASDSTVFEILAEIGSQPAYGLQAAIGLVQLGQLGLAEEAMLNSPIQSKDETLLRDLTLLGATKVQGNTAKLNERLSKFDFKSLDSEVVNVMRSAIPEVAKYSSDPRMRGGPIASRPNLQSFANAPGSITTISGPAVPGGKPPAQIDPTISELNRLELADMQAAIKMARKIVSKPWHLTVPNRPLTIQYMTRIRTVSNMTTYSGSLNQPEAAEKATRTVAFALLKKQNELDRLIEETRKGIEQSPDSFLLHELLTEYLEEQGDIDEANKALRQAIQIRPDAVKTRLYRIDLLHRHGQYSQAQDEFLELLSRDPNYALSQMGHYKEMFDAAEFVAKVLELTKSIQPNQLTDNHTVKWSAVIIAKTPMCFEIGVGILEKLNAANLQFGYPIETLDLMYQTIGTNFPRMLDFTAQAFIPNEKQVAQSPWFGFSNRNTPTVHNSDMDLLDAILLVHSPELITASLEVPIRDAVQRMPTWLGGKLLLASILANEPEGKERDDLLDSLAKQKDLLSNCPPNATLQLGIELSKTAKYQLLAIQILTTKNPQSGFMSTEQHNAKLALARIWAARGNPEKAVDVLTTDEHFGSMRNRANGQGPSRMGSGVGFSRNSLSHSNISALAHEYLSIGMPIESYTCFASPYFPRHESNKDAKEIGIKSAIKFLENMPVDAALTELLFDRTRLDSENSALELMIEPPTFSQVLEQPMESVVYRELRRHAQNGKSAEIGRKLDGLVMKHPIDFPVAVTYARWKIDNDAEDSQAAIDDLERLIAFTNPQSLSEAAGLWFVARACYQSKKYLEVADRVAEAALKTFEQTDKQQFNMRTSDPGVTFDQPKKESSASLLFEWGKSLIESGNVDQGKAKLEELIKRRPDSVPVVSAYLEVLKK